MTKLKNILCVLCASAFVLSASAQYKIEVLDSNNFKIGEGVVLHKTSFRGLSVVDDQTIWVSGSRGTIAKSVDGGKTFSYTQLKGYEKSDLRDIEAFDDKRAIIMSSGTPAYILKTTDGGQTWKEVYKNTDTAYFLDAMDFWDEKRGMLVGDPINGHFVLLQTNDGGEMWQELDTTKTPKAIEGEAVFAASGTSLRCINKNEIGFVTGGLVSRIITINNKGNEQQTATLNLIQGKSSQGAFSFVKSRRSWLFVGGDYLKDTQTILPNFYLSDNMKYFQNNPIENLKGYKSSIEILSETKDINNCGYPSIITTGTSGTEIGQYLCTGFFPFYKFDSYKESFHVVRKAKKGHSVFLAGPNGKIGKLIY
jgi:photosystem II stability/assembly factor-like uncharacterized protein